jgi:hypothetical protein
MPCWLIVSFPCVKPLSTGLAIPGIKSKEPSQEVDIAITLKPHAEHRRTIGAIRDPV